LVGGEGSLDQSFRVGAALEIERAPKDQERQLGIVGNRAVVGKRKGFRRRGNSAGV
jgi:hypothetical protein